ncbi:hypothetical protein Bca4012_050777 [Brassica carinata]
MGHGILMSSCFGNVPYPNPSVPINRLQSLSCLKRHRHVNVSPFQRHFQYRFSLQNRLVLEEVPVSSRSGCWCISPTQRIRFDLPLKPSGTYIPFLDLSFRGIH